MSNLQQPTLPQLDLLENKPLPAQTPRNAYAVQTPGSAYTPYGGNNGGYGQQDYDYNNYGDYGYNNNTPNNNNGYTPSPQPSGYTQNYSKDDYFQAKPVPQRSATATTGSGATTVVGAKTPNGGMSYDPYSETAYTDDIYDHYTGKEERQYLQQQQQQQQQSLPHDVYGDYYNNIPNNDQNLNNNAYTQPSQHQPTAPPSRTRQYNDYGHQRSGSPLPSQHGSDLDSNHYGYDNNNNQTRGGSNNGGVYGGYNNSHHNSNDYYRSGSPAPGGGQGQYQQQQQQYSPQTSPRQHPQRGRRQDTAQSQSQSRDRYRAGQGY